MDERTDLIGALKHHLLLERGFGVESLPKGGVIPTPKPLPVIAVSAHAAVTAPAAPSQPSPPPDMPESLTRIAAEIAACKACGLCAGRTNTVPGEGNPKAELVFIGEGPGADEDAQGRPFVGRSGELLTKMIEAMGFPRSEVFIVNIVKCRPPGNRAPEPEEMAACIGYLHRQLALIKPKVICTLGNTPLRAMTGDAKVGITSVRGQILDWKGTPLVPTFHPAYLLRNPPAKKPCWEDLKVVLSVLGRTAPKS